MMKKFLIALQFLTIFPGGDNTAIDKDKLPQGIVYFPLVGLFLGLVLAATNKVLSFISTDELLANVVLVTLLIILTAGLHLDGLADTFDALLSRKKRGEMLQIMRDSHIGTMGVLSLICILLFKVSLLCSLAQQVLNISLVLMCLLSRYSLVLAMFLFPYIREEGKAKVFVEGMNRRRLFLATVISLSCAFIVFGLKGLFTLFAAGLFVLLTGRFIAGKIGGMTGDTLGAINELTETFVLLTVLILIRINGI